MLCFKFRLIIAANLRRLGPVLAAAALVLSTATAHADLGDQLFKLLPEDGTWGDQFGYSVAISGGIAIVGAYADDNNGPASNSGSAYLFDTTTGGQIAKLLPEDGEVGDQFGRSVGISGTTAIVGVPYDDDVCPENPLCNSGSAYLFDTTTGLQVAKLLPEDGATRNEFGISVAISGEIAIVGAFKDEDNGAQSGSAYLFDISDPANPVQIAKLLPSDGEAHDFFGFSVAISSTRAIVGANGDDDNGTDSGSAYLFNISDPTDPAQLAKLLSDDGGWFDYFGQSVAISGRIAIVGAFGDDDQGDKSGAAYFFDTTTGQQLAKLLPDDGAAFDRFGISVGISGDTAIVGAYLDDDNGSSAGSAYFFDTSTSQQVAKILPEDGAAEDRFGYPVAIFGHTAIVGAVRNDDNGAQSGSAYLFDAAGGSHCPWDFDGSGDIGASDLAVLLGSWGPCVGCPADLDNDGKVGAPDLALVLGNWGPCPAIVCLDPKTDPTDLNCLAFAECDIDGVVIVYDLFECYCLEGVSEEECCDAILEGFEATCESKGGTLSYFFCICFP